RRHPDFDQSAKKSQKYFLSLWQSSSHFVLISSLAPNPLQEPPMRLQQSRHRAVGGIAPIADAKRNAPLIKSHLKARGCDLPFYDYLDSYEEEFQRIVARAEAEYPSLIDVRVVEHDDGRCGWSEAERDGLTEIVFDGDEPD